MKKKQRETHTGAGRLARALYLFVVVSFVGPIVYLLIRMAAGGLPEGGAGNHSRADYVLMLVECVLGLSVINLPVLLSKKLRFELPVVLYVLYIVFLYCAIFLGEVQSFYYLIPHWDVFLHAFSSVLVGLFGFMVVTILNRDERIVVRLSPFFVSLFAFSFAATIGALWEVYEFAFDGFLGLNMQKFITADGTVLIGRAALTDTMKDIIVDLLGALAASVIGYVSIKNEKLWFVATLTDRASD